MSKLEGRRAIITVGAAGIGAVCGFGLSGNPMSCQDGRATRPPRRRVSRRGPPRWLSRRRRPAPPSPDRTTKGRIRLDAALRLNHSVGVRPSTYSWFSLIQVATISG